MLRLEHINKYFYKNKSNQIKAVDDTSLEFGDTGLVALLGESGSGKTTLLNIIGGLDKWDKGLLYINGKKYNKHQYHKLNKIRNLNIGYIFQDYKIVDEWTVFDNVAISLKMIGIKDKKVIKERVEYVLNTLELYRYKNRYASSLSGGERQRVGIARAIAKNPDIVICDEPTGNLDSKNSIEIMNIIKAISKERLVILVTHEVDLAYFYADRIIKINDGKLISDEENKNQEDLDYRIDNKIYLKDIDNKAVFKKNDIEVNCFFEGQSKTKINLVLKGNNLYVETNKKINIEPITEDSKYELVNEHYKRIDKSIYEKYQFKMENYNKKDTSIYSLFTCLKNAFYKTHNYRGIKKLMLLSYFITGIFIIASISCMLGVTRIEKKDYVIYNDTLVQIISQKTKPKEVYNKLNSLENINYFNLSIPKVDAKFLIDDLYQTKNIGTTVSVNLVSNTLINESDLIEGRMPLDKNEIVIDKLIFEKSVNLYNKESLYSVGVKDIKDVVDRYLVINNKNYKIVGVTDKVNPSIYIDMNLYYLMKNETVDFGNRIISPIAGLEEDIKITKGRLPNDGEVIVSKSLSNTIYLNSYIKDKERKMSLKVVGYYDGDELSNCLVNNNTYTNILLSNNKVIFFISTNNKEEVVNELKNYDSSLVPQDLELSSKEEYYVERIHYAKTYLATSIVLLVITFLEIFFVNRSSFLTRIKEVGILRAIGVKKKDIYRMFAGEIIYTTTVYSFSGLIIGYLFIDALKDIEEIGKTLYINIPITLSCMVLVLVFNLLIGLLPVINTLRHTPASILARKDI